MLCMSKVQGCPDPAAFQRACVQLFKTEANIHSSAGIDLDKVHARLDIATKMEAGECRCMRQHCLHLVLRPALAWKTRYICQISWLCTAHDADDETQLNAVVHRS